MPQWTWIIAVTREDLLAGGLMMLVGMAVVFTALVLIMLMLRAMHLLPTGEKKVAAAPKSASSAPPKDVEPPSPVQSTQAEGITPEIIAIISAAVMAVAGARARVRSIRLVRAAGQSPWAEQGRSRHHQSHRMHRGKR